MTYELSPKYVLSISHQFCFWTQNGVTEIRFTLSPEAAKTNNNQTRHNIGNKGFQNSRHQATEVVVEKQETNEASPVIALSFLP